MTTGKNNTITRLKMKKQRRLLVDSLKILHLKFVAESGVAISYALFCRLKPFYVVEPTELDRQTCQCKVHENFQFMANALYKEGVIKSQNLDEIVEGVICNNGDKNCAYNSFRTCSNKKGDW